jgi:hypothetical protein
LEEKLEAGTALPLAEALGKPVLERVWQDFLRGYGNATPADRKEAYNEISALRDGFLHALRDIEDAEDRTAITVMFFLEANSARFRLKTQIHHQATGGIAEPRLVCREAMLSALADTVQPYVNPALIERIATLVSKNDSPFGHSGALSPPPGEDGGELEARLSQLHKTIEILKRDVSRLYSEREILTEALGRSDVYDIITLFRRYEAMAREKGTGGTGNGDIAVVLAELEQLRSERVALLQASGRSDLSELVGDFQRLRKAHEAAEEELNRLRASQNLLQEHLGKVDAITVVTQMRSLSRQVSELRMALEVGIQLDAILSTELGTSKPEEVTAALRYLKSRDQQRDVQPENTKAVEKRIRALQSTIADLGDRLARFERDRQILEQEIGSADARFLIERIRDLQTRTR